ncbi:MAG: iron-containing alcohol dehydrogenase [Verrucomicrobiia bacterium]
MDFEFATAARIVFGPGRCRELPTLVKGLGSRALIVTGRTPERAEVLRKTLQAANIEAALFATPGEPSVHDVQGGVQTANDARCDFVIGYGGGSALDAAKAIAALLANPGDIYEYLEVVGRGQPLLRPSLPCVAIPTTAGTGTEVTRNAVLSSPEHRFKVSLRSPWMLPRIALVDPELTWGLPPALTATTGLDALTQLIEPYVSHRANPFTDGFCKEGLRLVARSLWRAFEHGRDTQAREDMALASLLGGLSLANAGLGAVHGFAAPIGGMFPAPHGAVCAALLPHVMDVNIRALRQRVPGGDALARYVDVARILTGSPSATAEDGVAWVGDLTRNLGVAPLRQYGLKDEHFPELVGKAAKASSMKANPIPLTPDELRDALTSAW